MLLEERKVLDVAAVALVEVEAVVFCVCNHNVVEVCSAIEDFDTVVVRYKDFDVFERCA